MKRLLPVLMGFVFLLLSSTEGWSLPPCPKDAFKVWTNCVGTHSDLFGNKYVGEFKDGKFHGKGTLTHSDGSAQKGAWENGRLKNGKTSLSGSGSPTATEKTYDENSLYRSGSGTGFAVSESGHIVTNFHVVENCDEVDFLHQGKEIVLNPVFVDSNNDLALLKGDFKPDRIFRLSRKDPKLMQEIFVAGYPFGDEYSTAIKVTKGVVSSLVGYADNVSNFQFDAAINIGNSGGPIFSVGGNVVGVTVSGLDEALVQKETGDTPQNANFGIKTSVVLNLMESNSITLVQPNKGTISRDDLRKTVNGATYYLQCYKTGERIKKEEEKD